MSGLNNFKADVSFADHVIEKFYENPGKFASVVLRMYWDMKTERDTLIDDLKVLKEKNEKLERENKEIKQWYQMHKECADAVYKKNKKLKNRAENAMELAERSNCGVLKLERENEK